MHSRILNQTSLGFQVHVIRSKSESMHHCCAAHHVIYCLLVLNLVRRGNPPESPKITSSINMVAGIRYQFCSIFMFFLKSFFVPMMVKSAILISSHAGGRKTSLEISPQRTVPKSSLRNSKLFIQNTGIWTNRTGVYTRKTSKQCYSHQQKPCSSRKNWVLRIQELNFQQQT